MLPHTELPPVTVGTYTCCPSLRCRRSLCYRRLWCAAMVNPSFYADIVVDVSAYDSLLLDLGVLNELGCRLECRWLLKEGWVCLNEHLRRCICCYATVHKEVRFGLTCILTDRQRVESKAMLPLESRSCVKENVALTHFDEEFIQEDPKELSYAQEKVKEDVGLGSGLEAVEKKLEKDGTYSSREQGEADWQLASETDLQDFHYTIFEHKWAGIQGLGSNLTMRSWQRFYSIIIFACSWKQHVLYLPLALPCYGIVTVATIFMVYISLNFMETLSPTSLNSIWGAAPTPDQCGAISSPLLVARTTPLPLGYSNKTNRNKPATLAFMYAFQAEPDPSEFGS
ncbi:hypothetical protein Tco_0884517 [Tanacetum coccineum]